MTTFNKPDNLPSITKKITIRDRYEIERDLYLMIAWYHGRPVWVEVVLSRAQAGRSTPQDPRDIECYGQMMESIRSVLEVICVQATTLLLIGKYNLEKLADEWAATRFEPSGKYINNTGVSTGVLSPLDAASRVIRENIDTWGDLMKWIPTEEEVEQMISQCMEKLEAEPDLFTGWETNFLQDVEQRNETGHLSDEQLQKLEEIHEERNCG